ncbi:hypothetical protein H4J57_19005 [Colwellia sp. BRX8-7]|jgi:hypothetical protein|uniref:DUF6236 family protein n=1 Tax=Colwellia sp. BRX8-7 TaxID=2759833 RepID=UPI0015F6E555|nr:DUF6236 family protein [Colwellia sp. BRX8-7]MBA6339279.1 hypothetical protein [Colwellia sp. BRX8-7]
MNRKGLIIPSGTIITDSGRSTHFGGSIDPALIRNWVMFWDEFICPDNNIVSAGLSPELEFLQQNNLLIRNRIPFSGGIGSGDFGKLFLAAQEITYMQKKVEEPGKWSMAQSEGIIIGQCNSQNTEACLVFNLINSIQLPDRLVPINEILEFKEKRRDELLAFHSYLEDIYLRVSVSKDIPRSKTHELAKLELAISEYNKTVREKFPKRLLSSLRIILDRSLLTSAGMAMGAASLAPSIGLPALGAGAMVGSASFAIQSILTEQTKNTGMHPLTYVTKIESELF